RRRLLTHVASSSTDPPCASPKSTSMPFQVIEYMCEATPSCRVLLRQTEARARFRAIDSEGSRMEISKAMIATTTSTSISVKPPARPLAGRFRIVMDPHLIRRAHRPERVQCPLGANAHVNATFDYEE